MSVHSMPLLGEQVGRRWAREVLERGRTSLEGAFSSRSRRDLARGGVQHPSEAESRSRGSPNPTRGGASLEGATSPRAKRSFISAAPCPSSKAEFHPRVARPTIGGPWAHGIIFRVFLGSFAFVFTKVSGFALVF
jgi:hypothetical protein